MYSYPRHKVHHYKIYKAWRNASRKTAEYMTPIWREGAITSLKEQLSKARTVNKRNKILSRLKAWGAEA